MKVTVTAIRADGPDSTIVTWALPSGHEIPIRYRMGIAKYLSKPKCTEGEISIPFEPDANLAKPSATD